LLETGSSVRVRGSTIEADTPWPGEGSSNQDPLFVAPGELTDMGDPDDPADDLWQDGDYRLQSGSPAIDAGVAEGAPAADIDGAARPCGKGPDQGAYESGGCGAQAGPKLRRGDANSDGAVNIADAVFTLAALFQGGPQPGCPDAADADDDGALALTDAVALLNYLFRGGAAPPAPGAEACGADPSADALAECAGGTAGC
jgi:hypothetical protein